MLQSAMEISHQVTTVAEKPAQELISRSAYNISLITLNSIQACMCMLGLITNFINIKIFLAMRAFDDGVTLTFLLLSVSDLCVCFVAAGISMSAILHSQETKWLTQIIFNDDSKDHSQTIGFFFPVEPLYIGIMGHNTFQIFNLITMLLTIYLAVSRCLCVMYPLRFRNIITVKKTLLVSAIFFVVSLGIRLPLITHSGAALKFDPRVNATRHILWVHPNREIIRDALWVSVDTPVCVGAQITLSVCVLIMVKGLRAAADFRSKASAVNDTKSDKDNSKEKLTSKDARIIKQLVLISSIFIICNTPKLLTFLTTAIEPEYDLGGRYQKFHNVSVSACLRSHPLLPCPMLEPTSEKSASISELVTINELGLGDKRNLVLKSAGTSLLRVRICYRGQIGKSRLSSKTEYE
ncbi:chemosensory receptor c [Plakobranchus ocellatus]|uniref:Chemosensory receptor c n=1 Tax=Plakobranchus ocellatus TaxID=259542 RepID=A0AAV4B318_9GAST|nr:chemosensory receptor c [Plakobranchus ocellatus]